MDKINIEGVNKAKLLAALYNASRPQGMGFLHYDPNPMTEEEAAEILQKCTYFDYLKGRVMKVDLSSDTELNARLYDRDNGDGAALVAVAQARGGNLTSVIEKMHEHGKTSAAEDARGFLEEDSKFGVEGGIPTVTLGGKEVADELGPAIDKALKK